MGSKSDWETMRFASETLTALAIPSRFGQPTQAFAGEEVDVPSELRTDEVLVWVMAAGVNYNMANDPALGAADDPMYAPSFRIWGYETSWGASRSSRACKRINACPSRLISAGSKPRPTC